MKIFLAGSGYHPHIKDDFTDFYRLESFFYIDKKEYPFISRYNDFLLDSGAFSFMSKGNNNIDWEEYIHKYAAFINKFNIEHFFELDIDVIVGLEKVEKLRVLLEQLTGKKCIPVWHKSRGKEYWLRLVKEYDYIAIGGIVTGEIKINEYPFFTWFLEEARKENCKVHGLGFTNLKGVERYPFFSVDSTSWLSGNRFGVIYRFDGKSMKTRIRERGQRVKTHEVAHHNFYEWVKFQKYADKNF